MKLLEKMEVFQTGLGPFACYKNDQNFYFHLSHGGYWEIDLIRMLEPFWKNAKVILDIGAHIGTHSFVYAAYNKDAKIYAFEPQKEMFKLLKLNMENRKNVIPINMCVGHKMGKTTLAKHTIFGENIDKDIVYGDGPTMNLGGIGIGEGGEQVEMITIDSLNLDACDFIKVDVEGAEPLVFLGGKETICKYKPVICFEYIPDLKTDHLEKLFSTEKLKDVKELLYSYGYTRIQNLEGCNWIAIP